MAKLSAAAVHVLLMVESAYVRVSWYDTMRPIGMVSPERGHGKKCNPRGAVIMKLLNDGLITGREHADLTLTDKGRQELATLHADGWELITRVGDSPRAVQR